MADNKLAGLSEAETRGSDTITSDGPDTIVTGGATDTLHGGQGLDSVESGRDDAVTSQEGAQASAPSPAAPEAAQRTLEPQADANASKAADEQVDAVVTRMEPEKDDAAAAKSEQPADAPGTTLNAGSVDNRGQAPDADSQATGNSPANKYPAPTPTRDSAVHQLDLKIAELAYFCNDFTHKLDNGRQAMVDAIRAYKPA